MINAFDDCLSTSQTDIYGAPEREAEPKATQFVTLRKHAKKIPAIFERACISVG